MAGILVIGFIAFMTIFPGAFTPYSPLDQDAGPQLAKPSAGHIMGIDNLGRDVGARVVYGARTILGVAIAAALLSALIGIPLGLISGFAGNWLDKVLSLVMDSVYSFPGLILAIAFAAMLGPGVINITLAVSVVYIPTYFRLVRGQTLSIKEELYVEAARAIGARRGVILAKYIFPNVIATVVVVFSLNIADAIMTEAGSVLYRPRPPRGHSRLGHGPLHGKKVPALGRMVDDHLSGSHDHDSRARLHDARRGPIGDPQPEAAGVLTMAETGRTAIRSWISRASRSPIPSRSARSARSRTSRLSVYGRARSSGIVGESGCGKSTLGLSILSS